MVKDRTFPTPVWYWQCTHVLIRVLTTVQYSGTVVLPSAPSRTGCTASKINPDDQNVHPICTQTVDTPLTYGGQESVC